MISSSISDADGPEDFDRHGGVRSGYFDVGSLQQQGSGYNSQQEGD